LYRIVLLVSLLLVSQPAFAHPHIFVKYDVDITQQDKDNLGLHFTFKMHNVVTSHPLFRERAVDGNLLDAIIHHPFYLFLDMNGHSLGQQKVELARDGGTDDEPIFTFDMDVAADTGNFGFSIYDPEYYDAVSLDGADAVKMNVSSLACSIISQEVGRTMWGINHAAHVECGDKTKPLPNINPLGKHHPFDQPDMNASPLNNQTILP